MQALLHTFLELGDAVSRNLAFAHANDDKISYGEKTVTETNLLGSGPIDWLEAAVAS